MRWVKYPWKTGPVLSTEPFCFEPLLLVITGHDGASGSVSPPNLARGIKGSGAPKDANLWCPRSLNTIAAGTSWRATSGDLSAPGRAFRYRLVAGRSASSWQGLVVVPGGAPAPPECMLRVTRPAGAAPHPASRTPREAPFSRMRSCDDNGGLQRGDKFWNEPHHRDRFTICNAIHDPSSASSIMPADAI